MTNLHEAIIMSSGEAQGLITLESLNIGYQQMVKNAQPRQMLKSLDIPDVVGAVAVASYLNQWKLLMTETEYHTCYEIGQKVRRNLAELSKQNPVQPAVIKVIRDSAYFAQFGIKPAF